VRYPTLSASAATAYIEERRAAEGAGHSAVIPPVVYAGSAPEAGPFIEQAIREFREEFTEVEVRSSTERGKSTREGKSKDGVEGLLSVGLYANLKDLGAQVLTDPGFWRYLGCVEMFGFVKWRDGENCKPESFGAGSSFPTWDCVPLRMYVRARICAESGASNYEEIASIPGTDLWRSHVLRVKTGNAPHLSVALAEAWKRGDLDTNSVREVAKSLKRLRSNVIFEVLDAGQAEQIIAAESAKTTSGTGEN
jgi:hypothetical protein